uniref:PGG domain-containing protein n=1 Tax=Arundo donax TaxID=35708 RepID=A0A0A8Y2T7_ARUDO
MARSIQRCIIGKVIRFSGVLSLSDPVSATLMGYISAAAVMGILTLNIYSASYFLAWRKEGSHCHFLPGSKTSAPDSASDSKISDGTDTLVQLIVVSLPFAGFPIAFFIAALAKAAQKKTRFLGCVAGLVICEIIYILVLGGIMMTCMSNVSGKSVALVTLILVSLLVLLWGCCCQYPKCLRSKVLSKCCCPEIDAVHAPHP